MAPFFSNFCSQLCGTRKIAFVVSAVNGFPFFLNLPVRELRICLGRPPSFVFPTMDFLQSTSLSNSSFKPSFGFFLWRRKTAPLLKSDALVTGDSDLTQARECPAFSMTRVHLEPLYLQIAMPHRPPIQLVKSHRVVHHENHLSPTSREQFVRVTTCSAPTEFELLALYLLRPAI